MYLPILLKTLTGASESLGMLVIGVLMVAFAVGMRWVLSRYDEGSAKQVEPVRHLSEAKANAEIEELEKHISVAHR
ncbi:MAG: hypothetical protein ACK5NT_10420 [Pyrinomonadaceae bacterium]